MPIGDKSFVRAKVAAVIDPFVAAEGDIEFAASVEPAQPVVSSSIQIIKERSRFLRGFLTVKQQFIKSRPMAIKMVLVIGHLDRQVQSALKPSIEIHKVWIDVIQEGAFWHEPQRDC
jgi:hypothetical protein